VKVIFKRVSISDEMGGSEMGAGTLLWGGGRASSGGRWAFGTERGRVLSCWLRRGVEVLNWLATVVLQLLFIFFGPP